MTQNISALKIGCGKFFHGKGILSLLPKEIERLGGRAMLVGGVNGLGKVLAAAKGMLEQSGLEYRTYTHTDFCTVDWAKKYAQLAQENHATVLVGCGGGKCIDVVKAASVFCGLPVITVPTSIATCVATSMVAIMYNKKGQRVPDIKLEKEVDVCIADQDLIASAPARLLAAGILDSMAKYPESLHQKDVKSYRDCSLTEYIQVVNSRALYQFLMEEGRSLYHQTASESRFKDAILTNLLHTSIVSGFADGSGQLAIGHATYDYMRTYNTEKSLKYLHGELVAVGVLVQMYYNQDTPEEIEAVRSLMLDLDMPVTLRDVDYEPTEENMRSLAQAICDGCNITKPQEQEVILQAIHKIAG